MTNIMKVAGFCVTHGVQSLNLLKGKDHAREMMPFLFEDGPGYDVFINVLKQKIAAQPKAE